jgi:CdiI N-terminal domain
MTEYVGPEDTSHHVWWPLYRLGDSVAVQNHLAWHDQFTEPFLIECQFDFVRDRRIVSEDGTQISEWRVSLESIREFAVASGWTPAN